MEVLRDVLVGDEDVKERANGSVLVEFVEHEAAVEKVDLVGAEVLSVLNNVVGRELVIVKGSIFVGREERIILI